MSKFVLDCDVVQVVGDNVVTYASDMDGAANSVASVSVDCPDVDLESPKQAIITNIKAASIKMKNTSNVINTVIEKHSENQANLAKEAPTVSAGASTGTSAGTPGSAGTSAEANVSTNTSGISSNDANVSTQQTGTVEHVVASSDTLSKIAVKYGTSVEEIADKNNIENVNLIHEGDKLLIPTNSSEDGIINYVVKPGDNLYNLAATYGTSVAAIAAINNIENVRLIHPGDNLEIPTQMTSITADNNPYLASENSSVPKEENNSINEEQNVVVNDASFGNLTPKKTIEVPEGLGKEHTYMAWQKVTDKTSRQYKFREDVGMSFDEEGFAKVGDRYVVACTDTYGNVGDVVDFKQADGTVLECIIGDLKSQKYTSYDHNPANKWGHSDGRCIVEFVVDENSWYSNGKGNHENVGELGFHMEWTDSIVSATNYGNYCDIVKS